LFVILCISNFQYPGHFINFQLQSLYSFLFNAHSLPEYFQCFSTHFLASSLSQGQLDNLVRARNKRVRKRAGLQEHSSVIIKSHKSVMVFGNRPLDLMFFKETETDLNHR